MNRRQYKRVVDWFTKIPDISEDLRNKFGLWLIEHENDPELDVLLMQMMKENMPDRIREKDEKGFMRLLASIRKPATRRRRAILYSCVAAAAAILFFVGGYYIAYRSVHYQISSGEITLVAGEGNRGNFTLPDSTQVILNCGSTLTYSPAFDGPVREVRLQGEGFFNVTKDASRPFMVQMDDISVEALGTSFDAINNDFSATRSVILMTGSVRIASDMLTDCFTLMPGDKIDIDKESGDAKISQVDVSNYCSWFSRTLVFDNSTFADIITNLERRYGIEISVSPDVPLDWRFSFSIDSEPLEDVMDILCTFIPFTYKIEDKHVTIM